MNRFIVRTENWLTNPPRVAAYHIWDTVINDYAGRRTDSSLSETTMFKPDEKEEADEVCRAMNMCRRFRREINPAPVYSAEYESKLMDDSQYEDALYEINDYVTSVLTKFFNDADGMSQMAQLTLQADKISNYIVNGGVLSSGISTPEPDNHDRMLPNG